MFKMEKLCRFSTERLWNTRCSGSLWTCLSSKQNGSYNIDIYLI